ncbi:4'-phosphopantetheinyl transferase superfamily protein [Sphaerisporangium sp. TRM90804]|uniref:4'-phosphopantetheinyl transferase family protein n=1 Tax=Sphaerisporangium sp. TRM90804 TaxID=3031113 RepID=UPI00244AC4B2|nr:4'-phosphopantetheinyl transferase superfamily protein [Sphaerisporangium sp. TRM90804]MDH2424466.1 4'-phosphopantetheinyl transferase superfamily protein [Sphaerisporangium sp. TRM90804]
MITSIVRTAESQVFWADPRQEPIDVLTGVLSQRELERALTYRRDADRRRFLTGAWLLRTTAAGHLGIAPEKVVVDRRCPDCDKYHGKPVVVNARTPLHVSVSHSADRVVVALTEAGPVGVDVERIPTAPVEELVRIGLAAEEREIVLGLPEELRHAAFTHYWGCKEAVLKATGHGLRVPPAKVRVSRPFDGPPALLSWPLDLPVENVRLSTLEPGDGYAGVVAVLTDRPLGVTETDATALDRIPFRLPAAQAA